MRLCSNTIREMVKELKIIDPNTVRDYDKRIKFIEGGSFDLEIENLYALADRIPIIGDRIRKTSELIELIPEFFNAPEYDWLDDYLGEDEEGVNNRSKMDKGWKLNTFQYYVLKSREYVNIPSEILGILKPRASYLLNGCPVFCTDISPGFHGTLFCGIFIFHPAGLILEKNSKYVSCRFTVFDQIETDIYDGIWGNGKKQTKGVERGY